MNITKAKLQAIQADINATLATIAAKHDVVISFGRGKYGPSGTLVLEIAAITASGEVETKEAIDFKLYAHRYGLKPEDLGREVTSGHRKIKLIGFLRSCSKYPFLVETDGKRMKFQAHSIQMALGVPITRF